MLWCICDDDDEIIEDKRILQNNVFVHIKKSLKNNIQATRRKIKIIKRQIMKVNLKIFKFTVYNIFKQHIPCELKQRKIQLKKELQILCDKLRNLQQHKKNI